MLAEPVDERLYAAIWAVARELGVSTFRTPTQPTVGEAVRLLGELTAEVDAVPVGLWIGQRIPLLALGGLGLAIRSSHSLHAAYRRLARYHKTRARFVDVSMETEQERHVRLSLHYRLPPVRCLQAIHEGGIALLVRLGRYVAGAEWSPSEVTLPHEIRHEQEWRAFVDARIVTSARPSIVVHRDHLEMGGKDSDPLLTEFLDSEAEAKLRAVRPSRLGRVQAWLGDRLGESPTADSCAEAFCVSRRTLHRWLREEGTSFAAELQRSRLHHATAMLLHGRAVGEVALDLGYADTSSFCRAFKSWTGESPRAFASRVRQPAG